MKNKLQIEDELAKLFADSIFKFRKIKSTPRMQKIFQEKGFDAQVRDFFEKGGGLFIRRNKKKKLVAAVLIRIMPVEFEPHLTEKNFMILSMPGDQGSLKWAQSILEENESFLGVRCAGKLEPWQTALIPWFESKGIGIRSVWLHGDVDKSLRLLRSHYGKSLREPFEMAGMRVAPAKTNSEIKTYVNIIKSEFQKNPQFGTVIKQPKFLKAVLKDQMNGLKNGNPPLLIFKGDRILGGLDIVEHPAGIDGKKRAAFGMNLSSKIQGKGFSRALYEIILLELQKRRFKTYYGNTGQPGVMRIGKIMGRWTSGYSLDRGIAKPFPKDHFKLWL